MEIKPPDPPSGFMGVSTPPTVRRTRETLGQTSSMTEKANSDSVQAAQAEAQPQEGSSLRKAKGRPQPKLSRKHGFVLIALVSMTALGAVVAIAVGQTEESDQTSGATNSTTEVGQSSSEGTGRESASNSSEDVAGQPTASSSVNPSNTSPGSNSPGQRPISANPGSPTVGSDGRALGQGSGGGSLTQNPTQPPTPTPSTPQNPVTSSIPETTESPSPATTATPTTLRSSTLAPTTTVQRATTTTLPECGPNSDVEFSVSQRATNLGFNAQAQRDPTVLEWAMSGTVRVTNGTKGSVSVDFDVLISGSVGGWSFFIYDYRKLLSPGEVLDINLGVPRNTFARSEPQIVFSGVSVRQTGLVGGYQSCQF